MAMTRHGCAKTLVVLAALLAGTPSARATGVYNETAYFTYDAHPGFPLQPYAAGRLGVIAVGYQPVFLIVAWRYLAGAPLTVNEQRQAVDAGLDRLWLPVALRTQS
jgi:hypothetical protein